MVKMRHTVGILVTALSTVALAAGPNDVKEGEQLYTAQCKLCHGMNAQRDASTPPLAPMQLALGDHGADVMSDAPMNLAFAPPFGPNLRGVYGRPAGTVKDFTYSAAFKKALEGMEWNDASLDVWITNTQAWVPGVFMFYKQPDPEIRRKIIEYLKANP